MTIKCLHGYFKIFETTEGQVSDFMSLYNLSIVPKDDFFTFSALQDAPEHSIKGKTILGVTATKTFEGKPWEVFKENNIVYDFNDGTVKLKNSVTQQIEIKKSSNFWISNGLILPGSLTLDGLRVQDYTVYTYKGNNRWYYSEVNFV